MERAVEIIKETGVDKTLERGIIGPGATGRRRGRVIVFGLLVIAVGVALLFFSIQLATRLTVLAGPTLANQTGSNSTSQTQANQWIQYGIWTVGAGLIAYGTNRIRKG